MIFIDKAELRWWDRFTEEGFRHVFAARWDEWAQRWLLIDWRETRLDFNILFDFEVEPLLKKVGKAQGTVVEYTVELDFEGNMGRGFLQYCSRNLCKAMGLGNHLILTPKELYRRLLANGGEVVYSWSDHEEIETDPGATPARENPDRTRTPAPCRERS